MKNKKSLFIFLALVFGFLLLCKWYLNYQDNRAIDAKIAKQDQDLLVIINNFAIKYDAINDWQLSDEDEFSFDRYSIDLYYKMGGKSDRKFATRAYLDDLLIKNQVYYIKCSTINNAIKYIFLLECNYEQFDKIRKKIGKKIISEFAIIAKIISIHGSEDNKNRIYPYDNYITTYYIDALYIDSIYISPSFYDHKKD